ncbi:VPLPA-CTERM sorting domain-containing protein [Paracoccaceae bacterium GXU_MW_L88]
MGQIYVSRFFITACSATLMSAVPALALTYSYNADETIELYAHDADESAGNVWSENGGLYRVVNDSDARYMHFTPLDGGTFTPESIYIENLRDDNVELDVVTSWGTEQPDQELIDSGYYEVIGIDHEIKLLPTGEWVDYWYGGWDKIYPDPDALPSLITATQHTTTYWNDTSIQGYRDGKLVASDDLPLASGDWVGTYTFSDAFQDIDKLYFTANHNANASYLIDPKPGEHWWITSSNYFDATYYMSDFQATYNIAPVPLPASGLAFVAALASFGLYRRKPRG